MTPAPSLQDLIADVHADAPSDEPLARLETAAKTVRSLTDVGDAALGYFVDQARRAGHSWSEIGDALGVSKQAAQQRQVARGGGLTSVTFERFTERARAVVGASADCAHEFGHNYIGTEHLLLAQFAVPEAIAAQVLTESGLERDAVRRVILDRVGEGNGRSEGHPPYTPRSIAVFTGALTAALELGHNYIGTEHLLFGLVRTEGVAREILIAAGLDEAALAPQIVAKLAGFQKAKATRPQARSPRKRAARGAKKAR
jgi:hypothetical protein